MVGCGVSNVNIFREAFMRITKQVQLVVFEKKDMNLDSDEIKTMLRPTTALFLLGIIILCIYKNRYKMYLKTYIDPFLNHLWKFYLITVKKKSWNKLLAILYSV